jgi:hypothetical protein
MSNAEFSSSSARQFVRKIELNAFLRAFFARKATFPPERSTSVIRSLFAKWRSTAPGRRDLENALRAECSAPSYARQDELKRMLFQPEPFPFLFGT